MTTTCRGSYLGTADAAIAIAERNKAALAQIVSDLKAGLDQEALAGMRRFFNISKPVDRENVNDREFGTKRA
jgi:hypothetical protein